MNIDELSGRELDVAVARHVFGHQVEERPNSRTGEMDAVYVTGLEADNPSWVRLPFYSRTLSASIQVELEIQKQGWRLREPPAGERPGPLHHITVVLLHSDGRTVEAIGEFEAALCRAALKAVKPMARKS